MDVRNELQETFVARMEAAKPSVALIVSLGRVDDPEAAVAEVWCRAWTAYAGMVAVEKGALARGQGSPHRWTPWFARIAKRVVVSEKRKAGVVRRAFGVRVRETALEDGDGWRGLDTVASEGGGEALAAAEEEAQLAVVRPALGALPARQAEALRRFCAGAPDEDVAREMGMAVAAVRQEREGALVRLRGALRRSGYRV